MRDTTTYLHIRSRIISWSCGDISGLSWSVLCGRTIRHKSHHVVSVKGDEVLKIGLVVLATGAISDEVSCESVRRLRVTRTGVQCVPEFDGINGYLPSRCNCPGAGKVTCGVRQADKKSGVVKKDGSQTDGTFSWSKWEWSGESLKASGRACGSG
jgi:hypothetical protein